MSNLTFNQNGVTFGLTNEDERGRVHGYHYKPSPLFINKTKGRADVAGLSPKRLSENVHIFMGDVESRFTIGFEVEKNSLHRNSVREYELFCGFEQDGSCGYEAVTHVLPLMPASKWRTKVYDMMHKAEHIIDDRFSPSDRRCGGHITIAVNGMDGDQVREAVRKFSGLMLAMFRHRLTNYYCADNKRMEEYDSCRHHHKYQVALVKGNTLEFRLPSRVESVKQLMRRYELMYEMLDVAINRPNTSFKAWVNKMTPLLVTMYDGDADKVEAIKALAVHFQTYISTGVKNQAIVGFVG
jgi:hypothetical protein